MSKPGILAHPPVIFQHQASLPEASEADLIAGATSAINLLHESGRTKRRLFHIVVECVQNIFRHTARGAFGLSNAHCTLIIAREPGGYAVVAGNPVSNPCGTSLTKRLQQVNLLSGKELTDVYRDRLQHTHLSARGGAGLGFLDIARRSGEKLFFDFQEISTDYCFFRLKVLIPVINKSTSD